MTKLEPRLFSDDPPQSDKIPICKSSFAREVGLSKGRISQLVADGLPVTSDGRIIPAEGKAWIAANLDPARRRRAEGDASPERRSDIEAEKAKEQLRRLRLENDATEGRLIDRSTVLRAVVALSQGDRDSLLSWTNRLAVTIAGEFGIDERAAFAVIDRELRAHLASRPTELDLKDDDDCED